MITVNPVAALLLAHQLQVAAEAYPVCPHGDPCCPCPDGLACHYETYGDSPASPCPHCSRT